MKVGTLCPEVDVLIVGYGPVGAVLACLLGRYGVSTLVIDKAVDILLAPRAIALDNEALRILQLTGLADGAFRTIPIPRVRMHCPYVGEFASIDSSGSVDGHPKLVTFYQPELERALRAQVTTHASVVTATGVELMGFCEVQGGVQATLRSASGVESNVRARFLVGADGASSRVRTAIGQEFVGETYAEEWLIVDALGVPGDFDHVEFLCDHARPVPHMVAPGGRTRWEFMLHPGESREHMETEESVRRLLEPWVGSHPVEIERKAVYRFHARSCDRYSRGRVFLAGDAAHITPPFVGQGLVAGLRDAANLAWKLAWVVRGMADESILDSYDQERRPHATKMINLARRMGQLVMPRSKVAAVLIHGLLRAANLVPPLRRHLDDGVKPKPVFDRGLFVKGHRLLKRGGLLPQLWARTASGAAALSDDLLGPNLALVGLGADAGAALGEGVRQRFDRAGGTIVNLVSSRASYGPAKAHEVIEPGLLSDALSRGWCAVVRPDRTILHDGPAMDAERVVLEALALLEARSTRVRGWRFGRLRASEQIITRP